MQLFDWLQGRFLLNPAKTIWVTEINVIRPNKSWHMRKRYLYLYFNSTQMLKLLSFVVSYVQKIFSEFNSYISVVFCFVYSRENWYFSNRVYYVVIQCRFYFVFCIKVSNVTSKVWHWVNYIYIVSMYMFPYPLFV